LQLTSPLRGCPYPQLKAAYLGCTLAEFTLALTGYPVTWFLWHFTATKNPVGSFGRRQVALPRLAPGAILRQMPDGTWCACLDFPLPPGLSPYGSDCLS